jgi:GTP pyrophosphokinase
VPLDYELSNGDLVEIITTRSTKPHQNWLNMAKTSLAKNRIRRYFKSQNRDQIVKDGKTLLNKQLVRFNLPELDPHLKQIKEYIGKSIPQREREEVLERIGNGSLSANAVVKRIIKKTQKPPPKLAEAAPENQKPTEQAAGEIIIEGEAGLPVKMANCCKSQAGDKIVGFVTRGGHITIHKENCSTIRYLDPKRLVEAHWQNQEDSRAVTFEVRTNSSRVGLLRDIVGVFADNNISLEKFGYSEKISPIAALISLRALMSDFDLISKITDQLEQIKGVAMVKQVLD